MIIPVQLEHEGYFIAEVSGGERGIIEFPIATNLILDSGIRKLLNSGVNVLRYISVGTGNSTPNTAQTMLDQRIATTDRKLAYEYKYVPIQDTPEAYGQTAVSVQFDRGIAAGNLTEVAIGWTSDGSENWSRSLFKDSVGDPTAITVKSDEFFRVTYVLRRYVPIPWVGIMTYNDEIEGIVTPVQTTVTVSPGVNTGVTGNGSGGNVKHVWISNTGPIASFGETVAYNQIKWKIFYDLDYGNPQIASITTSGNNGNQPQLIPAGTTITFDPPIPKTNEFDVTIELLLTVARRVS